MIFNLSCSSVGTLIVQEWLDGILPDNEHLVEEFEVDVEFKYTSIAKAATLFEPPEFDKIEVESISLVSVTVDNGNVLEAAQLNLTEKLILLLEENTDFNEHIEVACFELLEHMDWENDNIELSW